MANGIAMATPGISALDALDAARAKAPKPGGVSADKAKALAQDFEAVFLNSMFQQMFTNISGDGPFGGGGASGVWRSFLTDEYSKSFVKAGGIGLSDSVHRALIERQAGQT
jgi:Rod binding domain-containing protein